ncbi:helix-turn-helix domain-containing protein [Staphylococcus epidermidis]|uniref:helix-turn-helix domain-containing protein n=1 Tax=Staphylococcus epidermidis TaxID=1282 RepID=UPI0016427865|nr:helix-turn-helix transcriptional regulator [Staphylococcus epidermidis]
MKSYPKILTQNICKKLKKIRIDKHISQEDIAFDLDVSASYISQVENGKKEYISLYFVLVMCEYYDMPLSQILYEVEY